MNEKEEGGGGVSLVCAHHTFKHSHSRLLALSLHDDSSERGGVQL